MLPEFDYYRVRVTLLTSQGAWLYYGDAYGNLFRPSIDTNDTRFGSEEAAGRAAEIIRQLTKVIVEVLGEYDHSNDSIPF